MSDYGSPSVVLVVLPVNQHPSPSRTHEHGWRDKLDATRGLRPRKIVLDRPRRIFVLEDLNGFQPLDGCSAQVAQRPPI